MALRIHLIYHMRSLVTVFGLLICYISVVTGYHFIREDVFEHSSDHTTSWEMDILKLDPRIRDFVLFPISIVMFLQGLLRANISVLLKSDPIPPSLEKFQQAQMLKRSKKFRENARFLTPEAFQKRKDFFLNEGLALTVVEETTGGTDEIPAPKPEDLAGMTNMMKSNMANILPNMLSIGWVSYFFSGFVLVKLPFPLTDAFKPMLQRGISLLSLDPSYVSSLSWYFLNLFGLRGLFSLLLGKEAPDDSALAQMGPMGAGAMPGAGLQDPQKPIKQERDEIMMVSHKFVLSNAQYTFMNEPTPDF